MKRYLVIALCAALLAANSAAAQVDIGFGGVSYDRDTPVEVTSEDLTLDQDAGVATFTGDVVVIQGDLRLSAQNVRVFYDTEGTQEVREIVATGNVLITRGVEAAEGARAEFVVATSLLTLTGDVVVTQGNTTIAGDQLVVNMDTGNGRVGGRVRTVLGGGN